MASRRRRQRYLVAPRRSITPQMPAPWDARAVINQYEVWGRSTDGKKIGPVFGVTVRAPRQCSPCTAQLPAAPLHLVLV